MKESKTKNLTRFHKEIRKEFNKLNKVFAEFIDEKDDVISSETWTSKTFFLELQLGYQLLQKFRIYHWMHKLYSRKERTATLDPRYCLLCSVLGASSWHVRQTLIQ